MAAFVTVVVIAAMAVLLTLLEALGLRLCVPPPMALKGISGMPAVMTA